MGSNLGRRICPYQDLDTRSVEASSHVRGHLTICHRHAFRLIAQRLLYQQICVAVRCKRIYDEATGKRVDDLQRLRPDGSC